MVVENVDDVPDFAAAVVNRRAGHPDNALAAFRQQRRGGVLFRPRVAKLLDFVEDDRSKRQRRQHALPPAQKQVVHDVHVRFRQVVGLQALDDVHARRFAVHSQETQRFLLPVAGQVRGRNHQRGQ